MRLRTHQRKASGAGMAAAREARGRGDPGTAFRHLERARIIGRRNTWAHARAHPGMPRVGWQRRDLRELAGQLLRMPAALTRTVIRVPAGNTGGACAGAFKPMPVPYDLKPFLD